MSSYLEDTFLGAPIDDPTTEIGSPGNLPAVRQAPQPPAEPMVRLPGGIVLPRATAITLLVVAVAIALYFYSRRKRKD